MLFLYVCGWFFPLLIVALLLDDMFVLHSPQPFSILRLSTR
jgi:hypothetical protein